MNSGNKHMNAVEAQHVVLFALACFSLVLLLLLWTSFLSFMVLMCVELDDGCTCEMVLGRLNMLQATQIQTENKQQFSHRKID